MMCYKMNMKLLKTIIGAAVLGGILATSSLALAADESKPADAKPADAKSVKPYPLKTCLVSDEKLGGDMGKPYVFVEKGQEIKLCCKSCLKDYQKEPAKYLKKIAAAQKGEKKAPAKSADHDHSGHQH